jgi:competence protein ComEA
MSIRTSFIHVLKDFLAAARQRFADSPWRSVALRSAGYAAGFALLALVGSGRMARWLSPATPHLGIAVAEAAAPPVSSGSPEATPTAAATAPPTASASGEASPAAPETPEARAEGSAAPEAGDGGAPSNGVASDGKVILNLASEDDLRRLPGVGHGRAQAILALRARLKKFSRVEDLLKVKGIGRRGLARLRPLVRVD